MLYIMSHTARCCTLWPDHVVIAKQIGKMGKYHFLGWFWTQGPQTRTAALSSTAWTLRMRRRVTTFTHRRGGETCDGMEFAREVSGVLIGWKYLVTTQLMILSINPVSVKDMSRCKKKKQETKHFTQEGNINNKKRKNVIKSVLPLFYTGLQTLSD